MAKYSMTIEGVSPFNGLDVLVARDEGLFVEEGLELRIAAPSASDLRSTAAGSLSRPTTSQGWALERGQAAMFQG